MEANEDERKLSQEGDDGKSKEEQISENNGPENIAECEDPRKKLKLRLEEVMNESLSRRMEWWDLKIWNHYLYKTREMDCLQLPTVNAFLSEWDDDYSYDELYVFRNCRICLKIIEELKFAIAVCPDGNEKQVELWKEGIKNIQDAISRKLDYMSYMLLKDTGEYLNPKTENMEYGSTDGEEDDTNITLCLWANIYMAVRKHGMDIFGFSFRLPMDIVEEDCAVRLMHTLFDHVTPEVLASEEVLPEEKETLKAESPEEIVEETLKAENPEEIVEEILNAESPEEIVEGKMQETAEHAEVTEEEDADIDIENVNENEEVQNSTLEEIDSSTRNEEEQLEKTLISEEHIPLETERSKSKEFTVFHPKNLPPLVEPEIQIVDPDEYFVVGGIFYFDLYVVPHPTVRTGNITYIHREMPKLRRIRYKQKIVLSRPLDGNTSYCATVYEKIRFQKELENAIFIQLQLPKKVLFLENPEPARLFVEKGGYSKDCIYQPNYNKDTRQISFKTNQFGIFAMLQKKYENFPYKKWSLGGGEDAVLTIIGKHLEMEIQVSNNGYIVTFLHPDDELVISEVNSTWMAVELLVEEPDLEDNVYDCIALLSGSCSFMSVKKSADESDKIILEYSVGNEKETKTVVIRKNEVVDFEIERKRIEAAIAAAEEAEAKEINVEEDVSMDSEGETSMSEEQNVEKEITENLEEVDNMIQPNETQEELVFTDLYHYILSEMDEKQVNDVISTNACLIENVRSLLKTCRPISSL